MYQFFPIHGNRPKASDHECACLTKRHCTMVRNRLRNFDILPLDRASVRASVPGHWVTMDYAIPCRILPRARALYMCARRAYYTIHAVYTTDPVKCLLIIVNVAVLVVKCCESRDCLLMLLFWWLNCKYVAELGRYCLYYY